MSHKPFETGWRGYRVDSCLKKTSVSIVWTQKTVQNDNKLEFREVICLF